MIDPITNPTAFDRITLDGREVAVLAEATDGGDREQVVEQQQSPGFAGAYTVVKQEKLSALTYRFHCWLPAHFQALRPWLDTFKAGRKKRPPRVYVLGDLSVEHNEIKQVICSKVSRLIKVSQGRYAYDVHFDEYRKRRPIGGVAVPGLTATDIAIIGFEVANPALQAQLNSMRADAAKRRAAGDSSGQ
jgi:hypothetical protein